jgi:hypothetical protein
LTHFSILQSSNTMNRLARVPKILLPSPNLWDLTVSSFSGFWSLWTEPLARNEYRELVKDNVIKDAVLSQARLGPFRIMSLFHNLRNPLFRQHKFDVAEFMGAVVPALEVYQDTLGRLVHEMDKSTDDDAVNASDSNKRDNEAAENVDNGILDALIAGENTWRKEASADQNSLAARLAKMTTDANFDDHYYGANLFRALSAVGSSAVDGKTVYVAGSGVVGQVALLHAEVMEMESSLPTNDEHPEFAATDKVDGNHAVAARLDVLYEITQTFAQIPDPLSPSEQYKTMDHGNLTGSSVDADASDSAASSSSNSEPSRNTNDKINGTNATAATNGTDTATKSETALAVAVFEGWLHGGPEKTLRWKIAMIRDAHEFS